MKKRILLLLVFTLISCASSTPRDFSLGCMTDMECEEWENEADEQERLQAESEMDDLRIYIETLKVRT
jgi:hypothetical protein